MIFNALRAADIYTRKKRLARIDETPLPRYVVA